MKDLLFDRLHNGIGNVMDLRSQQSAMTAGNIANTDTPNYKAKFIPFDELLQSTMGTDNMSMRQNSSRSFLWNARTRQKNPLSKKSRHHRGL